ncbi:Sua5/YciO/YrdC/YwlC family protein [Vibrio sp.]|nr:Sua5/YciO/YrdC/YwlC family protein [Vibrio sp.]
MSKVKAVLQALEEGDVIGYPTEGVFGIGCDPDNIDAIEKLLAIKERPVEKGLILIAANYTQLQPYIDELRLSKENIIDMQASWPGPYTWIVPASSKVSKWVSGQFDTVAVRIIEHKGIQELCLAYGKPITSTSANLTGQPPCMTAEDVEEQLGSQLGAIYFGKVGGRNNPSEIRDARTGNVLRQG